MKILVACEESQRVCAAFREKGHEAYSCDLLPTSGDHPEWHMQTDVCTILTSKKWDMIIAFPPCTFLTVTGNRWFNVAKYGEKAVERQKDREKAIRFFMLLACADCDKIAIENPVGIMSTVFRKPDQIIHPWQFGDNFEKTTCLWLKNLPKLKPTVIEKPKLDYYVWTTKNGIQKRQPKWFFDAWNLPPTERAKVRSKTFLGIAKAMAEQWGNGDKGDGNVNI